MAADKEIQAPIDVEKEGTGGDKDDTKILKRLEKKKSKGLKKTKKKDKSKEKQVNSALHTTR